VALAKGDLPSRIALKLLPDGDKVAHQVTLDVCSADFPSEAARTARLQQAAVKPDNTLLVNNENVLYQSAPKASQAFDEIRAAVTTCPADKFVPSKVAGVPPLKYTLQLVADDQLGEVAPEHVAVQGAASDQTGKSKSIIQVFQRRGLVMVGIYGPDLATIKPYLSIVAGRLAALTPAQVGE
jgi:hypothetical protein